MDLRSREQYLDLVREEYRKADKKTKTRLLNEAAKRTELNRKVLIRKLARTRKAASKRVPRGATYGSDVVTALVKIWEIFDYPCGQRLAPVLRLHVDTLRKGKQLRCSGEVANKLMRISPRTIDRLLAREKSVRGLRRNRNPRVHALLYQKIPVKVASEWDTSEVGNLQIDYVEHCGRSSSGEYLHTVSAVDIASGWWEPEAITARSQAATQEALDSIRKRLPFPIKELHPDNDGGLINDLIWNYCRRAGIRMSRSRPYKKNDNAWVEQRNWTHVRKVVGYARLDTTVQWGILREIYACLRLYKNFFQPAMKLISKTRVGGKIHRRYDEPKTPYQRLIESGQLKPAAKRQLQEQFESLDVVELHTRLEHLRDRLFDTTTDKEAHRRAKPGWGNFQIGGRSYAAWMRKMTGKKQ